MSQINDQSPIIQVNNVVKNFKVGTNEVTILKGISFEVKRGEFVSIVGPSGNGKSTLLNMITGIDRPSSGEINVTGRAVHRMSENELAGWRGQNVGIIFQFFQMLPALSLVQNVILPMDFAKKYTPKERRERAMHLLELVGLAEQAEKLPSMVSGGQQQRAAIARALANDPPLLVADEPTGNLDTRSGNVVLDLLDRLNDEGLTVLVVTHDPRVAHRADRTLILGDGEIVRRARREELATALVEWGLGAEAHR